MNGSHKTLNAKLLLVTKFMCDFNQAQNMQTIHMSAKTNLLKLNNLEKTESFSVSSQPQTAYCLYTFFWNKNCLTHTVQLPVRLSEETVDVTTLNLIGEGSPFRKVSKHTIRLSGTCPPKTAGMVHAGFGLPMKRPKKI